MDPTAEVRVARIDRWSYWRKILPIHGRLQKRYGFATTRTDQGFGVGDRSWAVSGPKVVELGIRLSDHRHSTSRFQLRFSPGLSEKSAKKVSKSAKKCQKVPKSAKSAKKC